MRLIVVLFIVMLQQVGQAQQLNGVVLTSDTKLPVPFASVYLANTSVGTSTNINGVFVIQSFPNGRFDLVVSCLGYETFQTTIQSNKLDSLTIYLKPRAKELDEVVVQSYEKDGWNKWGKLFLESFIGTTEFAQNCTIKNYKAIRFKFNKKDNSLTAFANETLIVENKDLGYEIKYDLINFNYNFRTSVLYYSGYPFFTNMFTKRKGKQQRWERNRNEAYKGSLMHFMRAFYRNTFAEENFELRRLYKVPNTEKIRVKSIMSKSIKSTISNSKEPIRIRIGETSMESNGDNDSSAYYNRILREPDEKNILVNQLLTGDSIAYAFSNTIAVLDFDNYIQVTYKGKSEPEEYVQFQKQNAPAASLTSVIHLVNKQPIYVTSNGMHYNGPDLLCSAYWAWSEKLANLLPFDFKPNTEKK
jgi:hypothetical protein